MRLAEVGTALTHGELQSVKGITVDKRNPYDDERQESAIPRGVSPRDAIDAAKTEVELAEARFSERVRRVSDLGNQLAERAWSETKPILLATAAIATIATVAVGFALVRGSRTRHATHAFSQPPKRQSLLATLALGIATHVAKNMAERIALGVLSKAREQRVNAPLRH